MSKRFLTPVKLGGCQATPNKGWGLLGQPQNTCMFWDAGVDSKKGRLAFGLVIRDHHETMWTSRSKTRRGFLDPTAALLAVQLCTEMGIMWVILEGDAKNVIAAVNSEEPDESGRDQITTDIRSTLRSIPI